VFQVSNEHSADSGRKEEKTGAMKRKTKLFQASGCLLCLIVMWERGFIFVFAGTEASGGALTGPLENLYDIGFLLFAIALLLTFFFPRISAGIAVLACLLSFPLDLYFIVPNVFRKVFTKMIWEGSPRPSFIWNRDAILGVLTLAAATSISFWNLRADSRERSQAY
jgi:hypothetical protein